jgi:predicted nucleotidyltransferase component of viral defense system
MPEPKRNMGASVRARLFALAKQRGQTFDLLLTRYALERLLYRLSTTKYRERFVLKGAMLMTTWFDKPFRPTRDLDFLGFGDSQPQKVLAIFREICGIALDDGVTFELDAFEIEEIREEPEYGGLRIKTYANVGGARVRVVIDIGFGDAIEPGLKEIDYPALLELPAPKLRAYPPETVIAEKFEALVKLGQANSRMKDFYDMWLLARERKFESDGLALAIAATFARRETGIPVERPASLTNAFAGDPAKQRLWKSFANAIGAELPSLGEVVEELAAFLMPHAEAARGIESLGE